MNTASQIAEDFRAAMVQGLDAQEALQSILEEHIGAQTDEYKAHVYAYIIDNYEGERLSTIIAEALISG